MPAIVKPCDGQFSEDLQAVLTRNREREQWALHTCQVCGTAVGAVQVQGKWVPEQHWPSVTYPPRNQGSKRHERTAPPREQSVPAAAEIS